MKKITIQNIHPLLKIKKKPIQILIKNILTSEKVDSSVDVIFADDKFMRKLNRKFTKRNSTTDVLSFGMRENKHETLEYPSLGDIYVSLDQARRQAEGYGVKFEEEAKLLVAHGLLHLLGYDHKRRNEREIMKGKEKKYLQKLEKLLESF